MVKGEKKDAWWLLENIWKVEEEKRDAWGDIESEK